MATSLDATLQSETKLLQSRTGWMCGVRAPSVGLDLEIIRSCFCPDMSAIVSFKRFLSVKALSPRSGKCLIVVLLCTFSCTLNFEHCQRRHTCVVLPGQGDSDGVTKARPCCRRMDSGEKWSGVRHLSINNRARPALQPSSVLWPAGRQIMAAQQTGTTPPRICTLPASSCYNYTQIKYNKCKQCKTIV